MRFTWSLKPDTLISKYLTSDNGVSDQLSHFPDFVTIKVFYHRTLPFRNILYLNHSVGKHFLVKTPL